MTEADRLRVVMLESASRVRGLAWGLRSSEQMPYTTDKLLEVAAELDGAAREGHTLRVLEGGGKDGDAA